MTRFIIGNEYQMKSPCDQNCAWHYIVTGRTAKTITITDGDAILKLRVKEWDDSETVKPFGSYSMSPTLRAVNAA